MSETLRVIATIAIVVAGFIALISALSAFLESGSLGRTN